MRSRMGRMTAVIVALVLMAGLVACSKSTAGPSGSLNAEASGSVGEKKVLRVGMECAYPPFNWTQSTDQVADGSVAVPIKGTSDYAYGYDVMVAKMLAEELGWELEVYKVEWSSIVLGLDSNQYDVIIGGMIRTDERAESVGFSDPYYIRSNVIIVQKDSPLAEATTLEAFRGSSVTTQINTSWDVYCEQIPEAKVQGFLESTSEVVMAVGTGKVDCAVLDEPTALSAMLANPDITYVKLDDSDGFQVPEGQTLSCCMALRKGDSELLGLLNDALERLGWTEDKMNEYMELAIELQPLGD